MKPRITALSDWAGRFFVCQDDDFGLGIGDSPEQAYQEYLADVKLEIMEAECEAWSLNR